MKFGVLGATGPTGLRLLEQLAGKDVSVYVRSAGKVPKGAAREVVEGALGDREKLRDWAAKQDCVLCALGHNDRKALLLDKLKVRKYENPTLLRDAIGTVLDGKPKRIVYCSAYGTGVTRPDLPPLFGEWILPLLLKHPYADHEATERLLESASTEWVVALPGMLTNGPHTGKYRTEERFPAKKTIAISRADVADFMIRAATSETFLRRRIGLGY